MCVNVAKCLTVGWLYQKERVGKEIKVIKKENAVTYELERKVELHCISGSVGGS